MVIFSDATIEHQDEPVLITEENISKFKISDLVLPLPGYDVRYPENETKEWYQELLRLNGMEGFTFKHKVRYECRWNMNIHHSLSFIRCHNCGHDIVNRMHEHWNLIGSYVSDTTNKLWCLFGIYECLTQQINFGVCLESKSVWCTTNKLWWCLFGIYKCLMHNK